MAFELIAELEAIVEALDQGTIDYALCGGLAVAVHGHIRATEDIDLLVLPADVPRVLTLVKSLGFDVPSRKMVFRAGKPDEHHMQRISKLDPVTAELLSLDLLYVGGHHKEPWDGRYEIPWRGRKLWVVSRAGLATMKRAAGRPKDLLDLAALEGTDDDET